MYPGPWGSLSWNDYHSTLDKSNTISYRLSYNIINASLWIQTLLSEKVKLYSFGFHFLKAPILSGTKQVIGKPMANRTEVYDPKKFITHKTTKSVETDSAILLILTEKNRQTTWGHKHGNIQLVLCSFSWCVFCGFLQCLVLTLFYFFEIKSNCTFWDGFGHLLVSVPSPPECWTCRCELPWLTASW